MVRPRCPQSAFDAATMWLQLVVATCKAATATAAIGGTTIAATPANDNNPVQIQKTASGPAMTLQTPRENSFSKGNKHDPPPIRHRLAVGSILRPASRSCMVVGRTMFLHFA